MIETMPGGEPIILEKAPITFYCGTCMTEMRPCSNDMFVCPICKWQYKEEVNDFNDLRWHLNL